MSSNMMRLGGGGARLQYQTQPILKLVIYLATAIVHLVAPVLAAPLSPAVDFFLGSRPHHGQDESSTFSHGGNNDAPKMDDPVKLTIDILTIAFLVILGGIFAGLTLGLMGLDMVNLQVLSTSGSEKERKHALKVIKLLEKGRHWVLVVLLLGNVIVNETLPIFLSDFGGGVAAVLSSTLLIVIFGEIVPQSICARYGLAIGAFCAPMVHAAMILMAPIAWPTAKFLDWCLGEEHGTTYRKAELKTFVSLHQQIGTENLNEDEVTIIRAVLDLNDKTVKHVMTPIDDVFIMSSDTILDEAGVDKLVQSGYSRVPIHEPEKPDAIIGMLLVKNLIQYDPEDAMPVTTFHLTPLPEASPDLTLLDCLNYFQQGRSHMILVSTHPGESRGALGVVTLEDVIEEMIGEEIVDETDVFVDVHNKIKVVRNRQPANNQQNWQPLIRGIIERRRKLGGPMKTPLRSSYGTIGKLDGHGSPSSTPARKDSKYGVPQHGMRAVDKVAIKRPGSPTGSAAGSSRKMSGNGLDHFLNGTPSRRESQSSVLSEEVRHSEPFIVEVGSQDKQPRVIRVEDITEYPGAEEERAREENQKQKENEEEEQEGENRPLLGGVKKFFGGNSNSSSSK